VFVFFRLECYQRLMRLALHSGQFLVRRQGEKRVREGAGTGEKRPLGNVKPCWIVNISSPFWIDYPSCIQFQEGIMHTPERDMVSVAHSAPDPSAQAVTIQPSKNSTGYHRGKYIHNTRAKKVSVLHSGGLTLPAMFNHSVPHCSIRSFELLTIQFRIQWRRKRSPESLEFMRNEYL
jgi:hypothetical protein